jgi:hypothetical protein
VPAFAARSAALTPLHTPRCALQVQTDDAKMSKWKLSTVQFGQTLEFAWLARDLTPVPNQKARPPQAAALLLRCCCHSACVPHALRVAHVVCSADPLGVAGRAAEPRLRHLLPAAKRQLRAAAVHQLRAAAAAAARGRGRAARGGADPDGWCVFVAAKHVACPVLPLTHERVMCNASGRRHAALRGARAAARGCCEAGSMSRTHKLAGLRTMYPLFL